MGRQIDSQIDRLADRCVCCFQEGTPHPLTRALKRMHHPLKGSFRDVAIAFWRSLREASERMHNPLQKSLYEAATAALKIPGWRVINDVVMNPPKLQP